jgi:transposase
MRGRHAAGMIHMNQQTRATLQGWLLRQKTPVGRAKRARGMVLLEQGHSYAHTAKWVGLTERNLRKWARRFREHGVAGLDEKPRPGRTPVFPAEVARYSVKLACERPDNRGRSLSQWDCPELARSLKADGIVQSISPETIGRILRSHKLKPWRHHLWLSAKIPRVDEKTNLQPGSRLAATLPTRPGIPTRLEHGYKRVGALHLFAAFDTRTGKVYARTEIRKRQVEFLAFLSQLERELPSAATRVFLVMDNLKMHKGKLVQAWLATHPHFVCHFVPVHCSWMNQVEQWLSMLQRKRLRISDCAALAHVAERLMADVSAWNAHAHPFNWSTKSAAKVMAKCDPRIVHPLAA